MTIFNNNLKPDVQPSKSIISQAVMRGLAIVGFITLVVAGIMFAIYVARFTPSVVGTLESGTAYITNIVFQKTKQNELTIVPQHTTLPFSKNNSKKSGETINQPVHYKTQTVRSLTVKKSTQKQHYSRATQNRRWRTSKETTNQLYPAGKTKATTPKYYGLPDLITTITAVGYLTGTSTSSFVSSNTIPPHKQVAVKFRVMNQGTNITGPWNLEIHIPTELNFIYAPKIIKSLLPGQPEDFMVHFTNAISGTNKKITIIADPKNLIKESKENNNSASVSVTILGN